MRDTAPLKSIVILTLTFFLVLALACQESPVSHPGKEVVLRLEPSPGNPRNSEGDFIHLRDGRILFVYTHFTGGSGDESQAYLAGRFSSDGGQTWTTRDTVVLPNEARQNVMSVSLLRLKDGRIALFYLRKNSLTDCLPILRFSKDEARTWSEPVVCVSRPGYYVMNNDRAIQLKGGRLVLPLALHNTPEANHFFNGRLQCAISDDEGHTWHTGAEVPNPDGVKTQEPGLVPLKDGRLLLFCRTDRGSQFISFSADSGETWSPLRPSAIRSPISPASIERIPATGDLLLVWNDTYHPAMPGAGDRTPLNLAISKDEGQTWERVKTLETDPKGWYCYTAIDFVGDHVLLAYCAGNRRIEPGLSVTQITRLSLDWVYAWAAPPPEVSEDTLGLVRLSDSLKNARIFYSLDSNLPPEHYKLYRKPIRVKFLRRIFAWATAPGRPPSRVVSLFGGKNLVEKASPVRKPLLPGLAVRYVEGTFFSTNQLDSARTAAAFLRPKIDIGNPPRERYFGLIFSGYLRVPQTGRVHFFLGSNDGSTLFLDNHLLVDNDGAHGFQEVSSPANLEAGWHKITLRYFQQGGTRGLRLRWKLQGKETEEIPPSYFSHTKDQESGVK